MNNDEKGETIMGMTAVVLPVEGEPREVEVESIDDLQAAVGGWFQIAPTPGATFTMYVNEEGKLSGLPYNPRADRLANRYRTWRDPLVGDVVLCGPVDKAGDDTPFTLFDFEGLLS